MRHVFSLSLALVVGVASASACYSDRQAPPSFRYTCDDDGDCHTGQSCRAGLCETPCTPDTFDEVCTDDSHLVCLNGVCSSGCEVGKTTCPAAQECLDLGVNLSSGGSFISGGSTAKVGVCGRRCDPANAASCPNGDVCVEGFCLTPCTDATECSAGFTCQLGLCLPDTGTGDSGSSDGSSSGGESSDGGASSGATATATATAGDASTGGAT